MSEDADLRAAYRDWCWVFEEPERKAKRQREEYERSLRFYELARNIYGDPLRQQQLALGMRAMTPEELAKYQKMPHGGWISGVLGGLGGGVGL